MSDGRQLEQLIAFVEDQVAPKGLAVKLNRKEFDDSGVAIAEFDIEVRGKVGTGEFVWLIECRDRPSAGAAPGSWIEQLDGRRRRFNFNKVTAVSTTGFAPGAREFAEKCGIELREVKSIDPKEFSWMETEHLVLRERLHQLQIATINLAPGYDPSIAKEAEGVIKASTQNSPIFTNSTGKQLAVFNIFHECVTQLAPPWDSMTPATDPMPVRFLGHFPDNDPFYVVTSKGKVRVESVRMIGALSVRDTLIPVQTFKYQDASSGATISEMARFPVSTGGQNFAVEIHKIDGAEEMQIVLRPMDE